MLNKRNDLNLSFSEFLRTDNFPSDKHRYTDFNTGEIIFDEIIKYENLNEELERMLKPIGIEFT